jgi:hypothetical protein
MYARNFHFYQLRMGPPILLLLVSFISSSTLAANTIDQSLMLSVFSRVNDELRWMEEINQDEIEGHARMTSTNE